MDVLTAVLRDLYLFVFRYGFGFFASDNTALEAPAQKVLHGSRPVVQIPSAVAPQATQHTPPRTQTSVNLGQTDRSTFPLELGYALHVNTPVFALPTRSFDGVILTLNYGQSFQIVNRQGQWLQVLAGDTKGWVHVDMMHESKSALLPKFMVGTLYEADHPSTIALRTVIADEFFAETLALPLQDVEYALYRLQLKNRFIVWPRERPRIAGTWQRHLRGVRGIHLGVQPKTESVLEYLLEDGTGHIAFVESVYPDGALTISEIKHDSVYQERTLSKDEWKELRPVFIEVA